MANSSKADDINVLINDVPELTEDEKITLITAMKKAQELDEQEQNKMSRPLEGQLYKYTNVVKGWQYRWFILIPETGILEYYVLDEVKKKRPRGAIFLAGAVVSPSDEDGQSFAISAACGELYKLKDDLKNPPLPPREHRTPLSAIDLRTSAPATEVQSTWYAGFHSNSIMDSHPTRRKSSRKSKTATSSQHSALQTSGSVTEALNNVRDMLRQTESLVTFLTKEIEDLPHVGNGPKCCDTNLLLLKATSSATLLTLSNVIQYFNISLEDIQELRKFLIMKKLKNEAIGRRRRHSVIMNLMSQLKARYRLLCPPSFMLEPRSLLEMFADSFRHPDLLVKPSSSKKPFNPIIGEMFRCSWNMYDDKDKENMYKVTYVSEQVSHHPPISAFYVECPKKKIALNAHICVKSNYLTSYVAVNFTGEVSLHLLTFGETYVFSLPCAYLRCILTVPWIELGGRVPITCAATGYNASVTFQTKPQQSGIPHKVSGEIKYSDDILYRISGEWNNNETKSINVQELKRFHKHVRPLDQQDVFESRKLWQDVIKAILEENYDKATTEKQKLEEEQRKEEKKYLESNSEYVGKLFFKENDLWKYKYPLKKKII
ncbi:oxysterol-binding protein-related protein 11 [Caerostris extrusa]|uniref:Oxysterol-binding protein n=1 Tax=Caerostris extrusa TaxID=172846 RepID=A0AAV4P6G3_CAEEX|nr:oxysterol-binding protein-related protein 11 [Caerostris extrusa]